MEERWLRTFGPAQPAGLFLGVQGKVSAVGRTATGFVRIEYGSDGTALQTIRYPGIGFSSASGVTADPVGNLWLGGILGSDQTNRPSIVLTQYNPKGDSVWLRRTESPNAQITWLSSLTADLNGNLYVSAAELTSETPLIQSQYRVAKYSPDGEELWARLYPAKPGYYAGGTKTVIDPSGNLVVAGTSYASGGYSEFVVMKYDRSGNLLWAAENDWAATSNLLSGLAVDREGAVYLAGASFRERYEFRTAKFSPGGTLLWTVARPAKYYRDALVRDLAVDTMGNLVVTGYEEDPVPSKFDDPNRVDGITVKYDASGVELWSARLPRASPVSVRIDPNNYIYVIAAGEDPEIDPAGVVVVYSSAGTQLWKLADTNSRFSGLELGEAGMVYVLSSVSERMETRQLAAGPLSALTDVQINPAGAEMVEGTTVILTASAHGAGPFTFQWNYFGRPLPGETATTLTLTSVQLAQSGGYSVRVTHQGGETISPEAHVVVRQPPSILSIAQTNTVAEGRSRVRFIADAGGDRPLFYQWRFNEQPLPGATNALLELGPLSASEAGRYTVVVSNRYGLAVSEPNLLSIAPRSALDQWQWNHPRPQGNDLTAAAFGQGRYVVGGRRGTLLNSSNGLDWIDLSDERFGEVSELIFAQGQFVSAGSASRLFTSPNGLDWAERGPTVADGYSGLAFGNGLFVAVSLDSYATSKDGEDWTFEPWPIPGFRARDIAYGAGRFVAIGGVNNQGMSGVTSSDGITWAPTLSGFNLAGNRLHITYGNDLFVVVNGVSGSFTSRDGLAWTPGAWENGRMLADVAAGKGTFVAVGESGTGSDAERARLFTSLDGLTWTTNSLAIGNNLWRVAFVGDHFLALGDDGNLFSSSDGYDWTAICASTDVNLRTVAEGAGRFVAVGASGRVLALDDRGQWRRKDAGIARTLVGLAYGAGTFAALADKGHVHISSDGETWISQAIGTNRWSEILFANGLFVAVGESGSIVTSPTGADWTSRSSGTSAPLRSVIYDGGKFVAAGDPDTLVTSPDGITWSSQTSTETLGGQLAYGNGLYLLASGSIVAVSSDLRVWTARTLPGLWLNTVTFGAGRFVAVGRNGTIYSSDNGLDWVEHYSPCQNHLRGVMFTTRGTFLAVGNNESIVQSAPLLPSLEVIPTNSGRLNLRVTGWKGQSFRLQTTTNLPSLNWQEVATFTLNHATTNFTEPGNLLRKFYRLISP